MRHIKMVFQFGWVYLRRYWVRLCLGILLGVLFGLTNASFVWATKTLMERLEDPKAEKPAALAQTSTPAKPPNQFVIKVERFLDNWLPRYGRELTWQHMLGGILFLPLLVAVRSTTNFASSYCIGWASERMINDMRLDVLEKLSTLSLDFFTRTTTGDLLTRINGDTAALLRSLRLGAADLVKETITLISVFAMLLWINPTLTLYVMVFVPLCLFPLMVLAKKVRSAAKKARGGEILQTSQLVELVRSIRIIKAYHLEGAQIERYRKISRGLVRLGMRGLRARELTTPLIEFISMLGLGLLIIIIFKTGVGLSDFVTFLMGMMMFFVPVKKLASVHIMFEQAAPGVKRLVRILEKQPTVREPENPVPISKFESEIRFEGVTFGYRNRAIIRDLDLVIPRGSKIGIAGPSGSGKSTVINLLFRFYDPQRGSIKVDGLDLRQLSFRDLRQLMALVSQEVVIFDQSAAENIGCGRPGATMEEIVNAARAAHAHDFITRLHKGYDTRLGEQGLTLSGGQRQRISIARAFIRNAPILVLDEATGSLDSEAEAEVQQAIERLAENRTVISVAHRLSTLANCDRVIVLIEGRIVEEGTFDGLLERGGRFAAMARRQGIFAGRDALAAKVPH
jgi:ATP-binding cassette, subfamily B, bacterial MsbA